MRKLRLKESFCSILSCCSGLSNHADVTESPKERYLVFQSCPQDILGTVQPMLSSLFPFFLLVSTLFSLFVAGPCISQTFTHLFQEMTDLVPPLEPSTMSLKLHFILFCWFLLSLQLLTDSLWLWWAEVKLCSSSRQLWPWSWPLCSGPDSLPLSALCKHRVPLRVRPPWILHPIPQSCVNLALWK